MRKWVPDWVNRRIPAISRAKPDRRDFNPAGEAQSQPFRPSLNPSLKLQFQCFRIISEGGLLTVCELDGRMGLCALIPENVRDDRGGKNPRPPVPDLPRQSTYSRPTGYEDQNDAERLS